MAVQQIGADVWHDMNAESCAEPDMRNGVRKSDVFVLFLSRNLLSRKYVIIELDEAFKADKPILLINDPTAPTETAFNAGEYEVHFSATDEIKRKIEIMVTGMRTRGAVSFAALPGKPHQTMVKTLLRRLRYKEALVVEIKCTEKGCSRVTELLDPQLCEKHKVSGCLYP
jgi:hypothetical protein